MKNALKKLLILAGCIVYCFVIIYLVVFAGGWKLWESGDPILMEILAALASGVILFGLLFTFEAVWKNQQSRIEALEQQVAELKKKTGEEP